MAALPASSSQPARRRGVILRRVSTDEQEDNFSLVNQEKQCRAFAEAQGIEVVAEETDVHSGYSLKRPGLTRVRELAAAREIDVVIVWKLDRLSRRITHWGKLLGELEDAHVSLVSVMEPWLDTSTPIGKHMIMTLVFVAEQERQNFMDRSAAGMRSRAQAGLPFGGHVPYGYSAVIEPVSRRSGDVVRTAFVPDPVTAPRVVWMFERAAEGWTTRRIANELTRQGVPPPRGKAHGIWNHGTVARILSNPCTWGEPAAFRWKTSEEGHVHSIRPADEWVPLSTERIPPLVSAELAALAHARLATNNHDAVRRTHDPERYLLRGGFVHCGHCDGAFSAFKTYPRTTGNGTLRLRYQCTRNNALPGMCCNGARNSISAKVLDAAVWAQVEAVLRDPQRIRRKLAEVQASDPTAQRREQLERQLADVEDQRMRAAQAIVTIADANVSAPLYVTLRDLAARAEDIMRDIAELERERTNWEQMQAHLTRLEAYATRVSANIDSLTYEEKRRTLYALDVSVTVWKPGTHADEETGKPIRWEGELRPFGEQAIRFTDADEAATREPMHTAAYWTA